MTSDPRLCSLLADAILVTHFAFVAFVVGGLVVIWLGGLLHWRFVRDLRFRLAHLAAMGFVLWEALTGRDCPLTVWEGELRWLAGGGRGYEGSFLQHWLHRLLFFQASETTFAVVYAVFFGLLCLSWWVVRPRRCDRVR
jgi:hypothetical protein